MSDRETGDDAGIDAGTDPGTAESDSPREDVTSSADESDTGDDTVAGDGSGATAEEGGGRFAAEKPIGYLKWAAVAVLAVTALVALFGFYTGVSRIISVWVSRPYRPVVNAAFNLALLLAALGGIGFLVRGRD